MKTKVTFLPTLTMKKTTKVKRFDQSIQQLGFRSVKSNKEKAGAA